MHFPTSARVSLSVFVMLIGTSTAHAAPYSLTDDGYVSVDATITHDVTPSSVNVSISCSSSEAAPKEAAMKELKQFAADIRKIGGAASVRMIGTPTVYEDYSDPEGDSELYTGSVSLYVRNVAKDKIRNFMESVESLGCTGTWDVRVDGIPKFSPEQRAAILKQIQEKVAFFEDMLQKKLTKVSSASMTSMVDNYSCNYGSCYDAETNTTIMTTTVNMTFAATARAAAK